MDIPASVVSADVVSFARVKASNDAITTEPCLLKRPVLSPVADPSEGISTQLPVHVSPDSSPLKMLLSERCSLSYCACWFCVFFSASGTVTDKPSTELHLTYASCLIASPGCLFAAQLCSSFSF